MCLGPPCPALLCCTMLCCPFFTSIISLCLVYGRTSFPSLFCVITLPPPSSSIFSFPNSLPPSLTSPLFTLYPLPYSLPLSFATSADHTLVRCPSDDSLTLDGRESYQSLKTGDDGAQTVNSHNSSAKQLFENIVEPGDGGESVAAVFGGGEGETGNRVYSSGCEAFGDVHDISNTGRSDSTLTVAGG